MADDRPEPVHSPNDRFFKEVFSDKEVAADFLPAHLPPGVLADVDWGSLKLEPGSFVDEQLAAHSSDLLYSVKWRNSELYFYFLFEHKSTPETDLPL